MKDNIHITEYFAQAVRITNITHDKFHVRGQILWRVGLVNLRRQIIQNTNAMTCFKQAIRQMRADKTGTAGN